MPTKHPTTISGNLLLPLGESRQNGALWASGDGTVSESGASMIAGILASVSFGCYLLMKRADARYYAGRKAFEEQQKKKEELAERP